MTALFAVVISLVDLGLIVLTIWLGTRYAYRKGGWLDRQRLKTMAKMYQEHDGDVPPWWVSELAEAGKLPAAEEEPERPEFIETFRSPDGRTVMSSRGGVGWTDATLPPKRHKCFVQTEGWINYFTQVWRCACGAICMPRPGDQVWTEKNRRRDEMRASL